MNEASPSGPAEGVTQSPESGRTLKAGSPSSGSPAERHQLDAGSRWARWDPHIHAPGTLLNDNFAGDWDGFLTSVETSEPRIQALGVTDYLSIGTYRVARAHWQRGRMKDVAFLFPNVEMRLEIPTARGRGVNVHLLFSPHDSGHEGEIERILGRLSFAYNGSTFACRNDDLERLGRLFKGPDCDPIKARSCGANQFKVSIDELLGLFEDEAWLQTNCLLAVAAAEGDGTGGLRGEGSFDAVRQKVESAADIVFSGKPTDRQFWLGQKPNFDRHHIEQTYRFLKPCLHGSDAHRVSDVGVPALERYCWLRADLRFDGLRQVVLEPDRRVRIGSRPPDAEPSENQITKIAIRGAPWLSTPELPLNGGLVAIVGARGSGKTALADAIAAGTLALAPPLPESSFVRRASDRVNHLAGAAVKLTWGGANETIADFSASIAEEAPRARYLSQHFVERLCSADGLSDDLVHEIENVVFEETDKSRRMEETSFSGLREARLRSIESALRDLDHNMQEVSEKIDLEHELSRKVAPTEKELAQLRAKLTALNGELVALVPKDKTKHLERLAAVEAAIDEASTKVQRVEKRMARLQELKSDAARLGSKYVERLGALRAEYADLELPAEVWSAMEVVYRGDPSALIDSEHAVAMATAASLRTAAAQVAPAPNGPMASWPLEVLMRERICVQKEVGTDKALEFQFGLKSRERTSVHGRIGQLEPLLTQMRGADARRAELVQRRRGIYASVFDCLRAKEDALAELYGPLRKRLAQDGASLSKLTFHVRRRVDTKGWAERGERLLDLRIAGAFRGHGALESAANTLLAASWRAGDAKDVASAMERFIAEYGADLRKGSPFKESDPGFTTWLKSLTQWLFSVDHVTLDYGIRYEGAELEQLSPGTRGIVLLVLYLAVDLTDRRPLIVDQPEENLDPQSVFQELVRYFREARDRRQVILVTHNPNLVVNADADQVIVASSRRDGSGLPKIEYAAGSLENAEIRRRVCELLEGGADAFLERERRYRLRSRR